MDDNKSSDSIKIESARSESFVNDMIDWKEFDDDIRPKWKKLVNLKTVKVDEWKNIPPPLTNTTQTFNEAFQVMKHTVEMLIYYNKKKFEKAIHHSQSISGNCNRNAHTMKVFLDADRTKINNFLTKFEKYVNNNQHNLERQIDTLSERVADNHFNVKKEMEVFEDHTKTKRWVSG